MASDTPNALARRLLDILMKDRDSRLLMLDAYHKGFHAQPYAPPAEKTEYDIFARRCISNWMPTIVETPVQQLYVDGFEPGGALQVATGAAKALDGSLTGPREPYLAGERTPEWEHWQRSRMDSRQSAIYRGAFIFGHSFTVVERNRAGKAITRGLSALHTSALYEDAANDIAPVAALTVTSWPLNDEVVNGVTIKHYGEGFLWTERFKYRVRWSLPSSDGGKYNLQAFEIGPHGNSECPVTRFSCYVDLEGRTQGLIEPLIPRQDKLNQTMFDLLVNQSKSSFATAWVAGMLPPFKRRPVYAKNLDGSYIVDPVTGEYEIEDFEVVTDGQGRPIADEIDRSPGRILFAEDPNAKFGSIPGSEISGYISSLEFAIRDLAAASQTPPTDMLGQIANLSAEALQAAQLVLTRKVEQFKTGFGECWERDFNLAAELDGNRTSALDYAGEVTWRDTEGHSMSKTADALLKLKEIEVPRNELWRMIPGMTETRLRRMEKALAEDPAQLLSSQAMGAIMGLEMDDRETAREEAAAEREAQRPVATDGA